MKFVEFKGDPRSLKKSYKGELRDRLNEFMKMNLKTVKVEDHGYKSASAAYKAFYTAAKKWVFPIDVATRNGEVYLIRRDL